MLKKNIGALIFCLMLVNSVAHAARIQVGDTACDVLTHAEPQKCVTFSTGKDQPHLRMATPAEIAKFKKGLSDIQARKAAEEAAAKQESQVRYQALLDERAKARAENGGKLAPNSIVVVALIATAVIFALRGYGVISVATILLTSILWGIAAHGVSEFVLFTPAGLGLSILFVFAIWYGMGMRKITMMSNKSTDTSRKFMKSDKSTFLFGAVSISVDKHAKLISIRTDNSNEKILKPSEFSYKTRQMTQTKTYDTGGYKSVTQYGQHVGNVYVPGETKTYEVDTGICYEIYKSEQVVQCLIPMNRRDESAIEYVLETLAVWCKENSVETR